MEEEESVAVPIRSGQIRLHRSSRRSKNHSRHEHKCHKGRKKSSDFLSGKIDELRQRNYFLNKKVKANAGDSNLYQTHEMLSPFKMDVNMAYQHLKNENNQLKIDIQNAREENEEIKLAGVKLKEENETLKEDVSLMKNLVFKLNLELERYQSGGKKIEDPIARAGKLPRNYNKNFLRPIVPLLKAYSESLLEKEETIKDLESEYKKFSAAFNDLLHENEKLYVELEKKFIGPDGSAFNEVKLLKRDLEMAKQENNLLFQQIKLEKEKLVKIHSLFKVKVEEASKEKEGIKCDMEEYQSDLLIMKGKYSVLKQEFDRLRMDNDARIPLAVHTASVNECRKLFHDLKSEYENQKSRLIAKIKDLEENLSRQNKQEEKWAEEKNFLEKSNFNQTFEIETLMRKISELENQLSGCGKAAVSEKIKQELSGLKRQLGEANRKVEELSRNLMATRKKLQKAMQFAEEIVRGQESLLMQLHEKQKENNYMTARFGSLKNQLKDVERGAQEGLNSVEEKIKSLENENQALTAQNRKLEKLLADKEDLIKKLMPTKDSTS